MLNIINQLKFARHEFRKGFTGVNDEDGKRRLNPVNSIAWMVGHLAWHEQYYWLKRAQDKLPFPALAESASFGKPAGELILSEMVSCWEAVIEKADDFLLTLDENGLEDCLVIKGKTLPFNIGTMLSRMIYHYWYHLGEMQAVRQLLGHVNLPDFVSDDIESIGAFYLDKLRKE